MQEIDVLEPTMGKKQREIPIWQKYALTLPEASAYFHIGTNKLYNIVNENKAARFVLWIGSRALIKRTEFEKFLDNQNTV